MKTLDEMIEVMQAAKEGKEIQYRASSAYDWIDTDIPSWNWNNADYRIKPEEPKPEYVPYGTGEEFMQEVFKHKGWVMIPSECGKDEGNCYYPIGSFCAYDGGCVIVSEEPISVSFEDLLRIYVWADDRTPCGKLKQ